MTQHSPGLPKQNEPIIGKHLKSKRVMMLPQVLSGPTEMGLVLHVFRQQNQMFSINRLEQKSTVFMSYNADNRDDQWLAKLRGLGMSSDDEWKLANLRPHIWKVAQLIAKCRSS
jgi:hypothetical protein